MLTDNKTQKRDVNPSIILNSCSHSLRKHVLIQTMHPQQLIYLEALFLHSSNIFIQI